MNALTSALPDLGNIINGMATTTSWLDRTSSDVGHSTSPHPWGSYSNATDPWSNANFTESNNGTAGKKMMTFHQREQIIFLIVLFILILVGNVSVLVAIGLSKRGRSSRMNFFIMHLAIADLLVGLVSVLTDLTWRITVQWYAGNVLCKIVRYMGAVVTYGSTYVLVSLSIDRLDAIARPMHFMGSGLRANILIVLAWSCASVFSLPMIFLNNEQEISGMTQCHIHLPQRWHWQLYITLIAVALFILPALIITVCYIVIIRVIWSKSKMLATPKQRSSTFRKFTTKANGHVGGDSKPEEKCEESKSSSRGVIPQAKIRTVKMTLVIVLVFILCWSPYFIFDLLDVYGYVPNSQFKVAMSTFIQSLAPLNSVANPIIYGIFSTRICRNLRRIPACNWFMSWFCCCCPNLRSDRKPSMMSTTSMSTYTSMQEESSARTGSSNYGMRRGSGPPLVRSTLTDKENDILMKNISPEEKL